MKLLQLTDNSWIAKENGNSVGTLFRRPEGFLWMTPESHEAFLTFEEFTARFDDVEIEEDDAIPNDTITMLEGYPIKHQNIIVISGTHPPQYKRDTLKGKAVFAAGYWAVRSGNTWVGKFCPKVATIDANPHYVKGPFKSKIELNHTLALLNRAIKLSGE